MDLEAITTQIQVQTRRPVIIPVLDVMNGIVVHAVGGRRDDYRPLTSKLVRATDLRSVAAALLEVIGARELYVADLDTIQGKAQTSNGLQKLLETTNVPIWLDGGFGYGQEMPSYFEYPLVRPVIGFETCRKSEYLRELFSSSYTKRDICFSIDLRNGELIGDWQAWGLQSARDCLGLARRVVEMGCHNLIVLDLARVGTASGCGTDELLHAIRGEFPEIQLIAGGGVKSWEDIDRLGECGVDAVLLASALHKGQITLPRPVSPFPRP